MREKISALFDGELDHDEQEEVLQSICHDTDLSATWQRYHLIRAVVRNESVIHTPNLSERMKTVLQDEQRTQSTPPQRRYSIGRWLPGVALAASVAGLVAFGLLTTWPTQKAPVSNEDKIALMDQATKWETSTPALENTLNAFLVEHGEFTPMSNMNGLMAYAKFVSYDGAK